MQTKTITKHKPIPRIKMKALEAFLKGHIIEANIHGKGLRKFRYAEEDEELYEEVNDDLEDGQRKVYLALFQGIYFSAEKIHKGVSHEIWLYSEETNPMTYIDLMTDDELHKAVSLMAFDEAIRGDRSVRD